MSRHIIRVMLLAAIAGASVSAQTNAQQPINDLPNPYRTVRDWGKPPGGVPWAAVTAVEVSPDGSIYVIHRCKDNSCAGRPEPPILKFDKAGKLLKAWGENMFTLSECGASALPLALRSNSTARSSWLFPTAGV